MTVSSYLLEGKITGASRGIGQAIARALAGAGAAVALIGRSGGGLESTGRTILDYVLPTHGEG